jgi:hypothetical protein
MLRWISFVPAAIVWPYESKYSIGQRAPSGAAGSSWYSVERAPAISIPSRALCCAYSEPVTFIWSGRRIG